MKTLSFLLMILCGLVHCYAQQIQPFKPLRYDEHYTSNNADSSTSSYRKIKYKPLNKDGSAFISLGGEVRYQYFYFKNEDWGEAPKDKDGYLLTRYLAHADVHAGKYFRSFVQLQSAFTGGKLTVSSPVDENQLDLHQAFIDLTLPGANQQQVVLRFGRQEFSYGSQRLVSVRDGPNNRQSFDAAKLMYSNGRLKADAFFSHYVQAKRNIFDDGFNKNTKLWGTYFVINKIPLLQNMDLYYFGLQKRNAVFDDGKGKELRHSIGSRIWKRSGNWQYDFEGLYQFGRFAAKDISAWTVSSNMVYTLQGIKFKPQIGLKTELISGDKEYDDDKLNSFNPLFPRGAYFGLAALIGPTNLADIHPSISLKLSKNVELNFDYDAFWRYSRNDGIYAPSTALLYSGKDIASKFIGQQYATELVYTPNMFLYFRIEFTWFKSEAYLKMASPGKDILFTAFTAQLKF